MLKLVHVRTGGLSFPKGSTTVASQLGGRLQELAGLIVEDALIPVEEEITLMIFNGMSPIRLQGGLALGEGQPIDWLQDFTEPENPFPTEELVGSG